MLLVLEYWADLPFVGCMVVVNQPNMVKLEQNWFARRWAAALRPFEYTVVAWNPILLTESARVLMAAFQLESVRPAVFLSCVLSFISIL